MNELILIRHGESKYNAMLTDNLDSELTEKGIAQAKATGKFLREHFGHIQNFIGITSPYMRCLQTSRIIKEETGLEFFVDHGPREIMVHYEEVSIPDRSELFPEFIWTSFPPTFYKETFDQFIERMKKYVGDFEHEKALVVSHGTPVGSLFELTLGREHKPDTEFYPDNASVSYIRNGEGIWFGKSIPA